MKIVILGAGNVATVLSRLFKVKGHEIIQIYNRNSAAGEKLARESGCSYAKDLKSISAEADLYLIAVSDAAIPTIIDSFPFTDKLVAHTAGSVSINVFRNRFTRNGILYPLQSITSELKDIPSIPFFVDGNVEEVRSLLFDFARTLSPFVELANDDDRAKLHLAAVIANNFSNYVFTLAFDYCRKESLNFQHLQPLLEQTTKRLTVSEPSTLQTGPAIRNDQRTISKHLELLANHPHLREVYRFLSDQISRKYHNE